MNAHSDRNQLIDEFLRSNGWSLAVRSPLAGDASFRRYERIEHAGKKAVLMDAPPPQEDVRPFIDITKRLAVCNLSVPAILAADETQGLLLLEDLGDALFTRVLAKDPLKEAEYYLRAADALIGIARASAKHVHWANEIKPYDTATYLREAALFAEWFLPQVHGVERARGLREDYFTIWQRILESTPLKQSCLVHRDYHADNLVWLARPAAKAVGMLDYQDALWGDPAYDVVSLLEDARRDVTAVTSNVCYDYVVRGFGEDASFATRYAVLGAQRNAKIIGIFTRLCVRDAKPQYLDYLPRVWGHFMRNMQHPALQELARFVESHVPSTWRGAFVADPRVGSAA